MLGSSSPEVSYLRSVCWAFWGLSYGTRIHCSCIRRDICSLLVSVVLIWLYTQAICASSPYVCSEVSTPHNQIILEPSNWKKGHYVWSNQRFMAHFLSCDLILLVSVKVAFDLEKSLNSSLNLYLCFFFFLCSFKGRINNQKWNLEVFKT